MSAKDLTPNTFMAALRVDTVTLAPKVFDYLRQTGGGGNFAQLMRFRQPDSEGSRVYWAALKRAVDALCRKRYSLNCVADRVDMMLSTIANRVASVGCQQIEHDLRNLTQAQLYDLVHDRYKVLGKWTLTAKDLGVTSGTLSTLKADNGSSFGPFLRETVLFYCAKDAAAGILPVEGFACLTNEDYRWLNTTAEYMRTVSEEEFILS